jgi:hypothetical protein
MTQHEHLNSPAAQLGQPALISVHTVLPVVVIALISAAQAVRRLQKQESQF